MKKAIGGLSFEKYRHIRDLPPPKSPSSISGSFGTYSTSTDG